MEMVPTTSLVYPGECSVCVEKYHAAKVPPVVLTCGHSLCRHCAISIERKVHSLECPCCRAIDSRTARELPVARLILQLLTMGEALDRVVEELSTNKKALKEQTRANLEAIFTVLDSLSCEKKTLGKTEEDTEKAIRELPGGDRAALLKAAAQAVNSRNESLRAVEQQLQQSWRVQKEYQRVLYELEEWEEAPVPPVFTLPEYTPTRLSFALRPPRCLEPWLYFF